MEQHLQAYQALGSASKNAIAEHASPANMQALEAADQALFKARRAEDLAGCQSSFNSSWIFTVLQRAMKYSSNLVAQDHCRRGGGILWLPAKLP